MNKEFSLKIFSRKGAKANICLKHSFVLSKFLVSNIFSIPLCKHIRVIFPLFEVEGSIRSKAIIIIVEFLEQMTGQRAVLTNANFLVGSGLWIKGKLDLRGFSFMKFVKFFNEFFLCHPLLRFSTRLPVLKTINRNYVKLIIFEIDFFFDAFTRRNLPHSKYYWLEFDFFFEKNLELPKKISIIFYTQFFFANDFLEWRKT